MKKLINKLTGGEMWVADNRVEKYLAAGHRLAALPAEEPAPAEERDRRAGDVSGGREKAAPAPKKAGSPDGGAPAKKAAKPKRTAKAKK